MSELILHTDGACHGNPGPGGFGAFWEINGFFWEVFGGSPQTTNNRMELAAVTQGLQALKRAHSQQLLSNIETLCIRTDSQYVLKGASEWMVGWKKKNWKGASGQAVKNQDAWQKLDEELSTLPWPLRWEWVKGHSDDRCNDYADSLAQEGAALGKQHASPISRQRKQKI